MTIKTKQFIKQASTGFFTAALLASLSACSGSGSPDSPPANPSDGNGGGNGGGTPVVVKPCVDKNIPTPNALFPVFNKIQYEYISSENDLINLTYGCATDVTNGATSASVYPLSYELPISGTKFNVNEFMSSSSSDVTLHGYKIQDVPLSIILTDDATTKINVNIFPQKALKLIGNSDTEGDKVEYVDNSVTLDFDGLTTVKFYELLDALIPELKKQGFFEDIPLETLQGYINTFKGLNLNPLQNGLPVRFSGSSELVSKVEKPITWRVPETTAIIREVHQKMVFSIARSDFISDQVIAGINVLGANFNLDFEFDIEVDAVYKLEPNVGPIERAYKVKVTNAAEKQAVDTETKEVADTNTQEEEFSFVTSVSLSKIIAGDADNDYIMDVVDENVDLVEDTKETVTNLEKFDL